MERNTVLFGVHIRHPSMIDRKTAMMDAVKKFGLKQKITCFYSDGGRSLIAWKTCSDKQDAVCLCTG